MQNGPAILEDSLVFSYKAKHALTKLNMTQQTLSLVFAQRNWKLSSTHKPAGVQPRWIQGIRSGDGVSEDQETTA